MGNELDKTRGRAPHETEPVAQTVSEDPFLRFLVRWRWWLFGAAAVLLVGYYMQYAYRRANNEALQQSSDLFVGARQELEKRKSERESKGADDAKNETLARAEGKLKALQEQKLPYSEISRGYELLLKLDEGKSDAAAQALHAIPAESAGAGDDKAVGEFFTELRAMLAARALLDDPASRDEGLGKLKELAERGGYTRISAALTVAQMAQTPGERQDAQALLQRLKEKDPAQASILEDEMRKLQS